MHPIWQLKEAVYSALTGDATLMAMVTGVYDYMPEDTAYPCVTLTLAEVEDWGTRTVCGQRVALTLQVFSRERSSQSCLNILDRLHAVLHDASLSLSEDVLVSLRAGASDVTPGSDGLSIQGRIAFYAWIEIS